MIFGRRTARLGLASLLLSSVMALPHAPAQAGAPAPATENWPTYFGNQAAWSYSALDQIDRKNVGELKPAWTFTAPETQYGLSSTPLVIDGVMYLVTQDSDIFAMDAATGKAIWTYKEPRSDHRVGPRRPLGLAAGFGMIYMAATDGHLVAVDQKTGEPVWDVEVFDSRQCGCGPNVSPLLVKDKLIIGTSSNDAAHRGLVDAYDAKTGKHAWRFWTSPGPGEPGHETWPGDLWKWSTTSTWLVGSYDPDLNLVYWGVGNPGPMLDAKGAFDGDKLYSDSILALDPDTGKLKWFYQHIPDDKLDYDSILEPVLIDAKIDGKPRKLMVQPTKSGYSYVLDRTNGEFISGFQFAENANWTKGLDPKTGHPLEPRLELHVGQDVNVCPGAFGARAGGHSAWSPRTGLWYNPSYETCSIETANPPKSPQEAINFGGASFGATVVTKGITPSISAFDPLTGQRKWKYEADWVPVASVLATGGDVLFSGDIFGNAFALDATDGKKIWTYHVGPGVSSTPVTYSVKGRQYVAIPAGLSFVSTALSKLVLPPERQNDLATGGALLTVFALPEGGKAEGGAK